MCVKVWVQTWSQIEIVANGQLPDFAPDIGGESLPPHVPRLLRPFPTINTLLINNYLRNKLQCWMVHRGMNLNGHVIKYCEAWQGSNARVKPYAYAMIILTLYSWIFDLLKSSHRNRFFCSLVSWYVYKERYSQM